jgi:glucosamine--fructose-6-phosphate aminotransferase (isomerizing)
VLRAIPQLRGAYGTVIMDSRDPGTLLAARSGSPLVIGLGMGENFIASDQLALLPVTRRFIFLEEGDIAEVTRRSVVIFDKSARSVRRSNPICSMTRAIKVSIATICRKRFTSSRTRLKTP